ncbi:PEP-CTERM sorting domain-containing protein [Endozoicomonas sp. G2_1]|uniref:PEP-CTERM sorting domain-containing protein n=1 Tax=Endozoicomonas sp. G2_1 TaxID=2821091 RepID=UPI001ADC7904|nr:PEP-CTERM sorting domain-containing protein [Endozoicomonas sp. G2_1]MBO9490717.1 PEP-CTERM sorting domain-containing protein [Endozoicomonas sp. G2_1]
MKKLITLLLSLSLTAVANATLLEFDFEDRDYQVGEDVAVNIVISDIENDDFDIQRILGEFAIEFSFNDAILDFTSFVFGSALNLGVTGDSDQTFEVIGDIVAFDEFSNVADLDALANAQSALDRLVLGTFNVNISSIGSSVFSFEDITLFDDFGDDFSNINSAPRTLNAVAAEVPEPSVFALFLVAGLALVARKKSIVK